MKRVLCIASTLTVLTTMSLSATAVEKMDPQLEHALVSICKSVQSNKIFQLRSSLREFHLSAELVSEKLMCNNESVHNFAITHGANRTANLLQKGSVSIRDLAANNRYSDAEKYYVYVD